jgi:hypothetical protein
VGEDGIGIQGGRTNSKKETGECCMQKRSHALLKSKAVAKMHLPLPTEAGDVLDTVVGSVRTTRL